MDRNFFLMRKNQPITVVVLTPNGEIESYKRPKAELLEIAPLQAQWKTNWLQEWWKDRSVPISQGRIQEFLERQGYVGPSEYLAKNLGLSLTDYYWLKPIDSNLTWEQINLYDHDFKEHLYLFGKEDDEKGSSIPHYSPNSSLQGQIEKTWIITEEGRCLVKGNRNELSSESINEVIISEMHRLQGYDNYTPYRLLDINRRKYDYGCISRTFTSQKKELISAYAVFSSQPRDNSTSNYEHFIRICVQHGMEENEVRADLEYQILADYVMSGYDRHLNNIGIIRDADTLKWERMAPIFDSGAALFVNRKKPVQEDDLYDMEINSFARSENRQLKLVRDRKRLDLSKLPSASYIRSMYEKDSQIAPQTVEQILFGYKKKIDFLDAFQHGRDPWRKQYAVQDMLSPEQQDLTV